MALKENGSFLVLRTPLLPFADCRELSTSSLKEKFTLLPLQQALYVASPALYEPFQRWLRDQLPVGKERDKLEVTLVKYLLRMAYRCTPFGFFAGISTGELRKETAIQLVEQSKYRPHSRLDMDYLTALALHLSGQSSLQANLTYFPNNTLYRMGTQLRYVEYRLAEKKRTHHLTGITNSEYVQKVLSKATQGAKPAELAAVLVDGEISWEEALDFITEMITGQVVVSELEPSITGDAYSKRMLKVLTASGEGQYMATQLEEITKTFQAIDANFKGTAIESYQRLTNVLQAQEPPFEPGQLFQVDMFKPTTSCTLNQAIIKDLEKAVLLLARLHPDTGLEALNTFRDSFYTRYEEAEIPLLEALDAESGLGYPVGQTAAYDTPPLLQAIHIPEGTETKASYEWPAWQQELLEAYCQVRENKQRVLHLDEKSFLSLDNTPPQLARSLYSLVSVLAASADDIDQGNYTLYHRSTGGPSAANLLGRFCYLDASLTDWVSEALRREAATQPEAVFAEIVHINQGRIGNISARPTLRDYEIPILVQTGVDAAHTIPLQDLMVSVRGKHIKLRSKKLNKEVIPRLSSAHNYTLHSLPVYQFLCDLQFQAVQAGLTWSWGVLRNMPFLPRVVLGKVILSKAQWRLEEADWAPVQKAQASELRVSVSALRQRFSIPQWITVADADNQLPLDLENELCLKVFQSVLKGQQAIMVEECLFDPNNLWVEGPEGRFTNEFIIPLQFDPETTAAHQEAVRHQTLLQGIQRTFSVGSEWLYYKIYTGVKTADKILTDVIKPLTERLQAEGIIDKWFFIRYNDPEHHIRVRFHGEKDFYSRIIPRLDDLLTPYLTDGLVAKVQIDTYQRELERYMPANMVDTETLFFHDSVAVVKALNMLEGDEGEIIRWQLALYGVDRLLNDFNLDLLAKKQLMNQLQISFKEEHHAVDGASKRSLGDKFRKERRAIEYVLQPVYPASDPVALVLALLDERSRHWLPALRRIQHNVEPTTVLPSYIHMFLNRWFRSKQRLQEMVVYDLLHQHYTSLLAREKKPSVIPLEG